MKSGGNVLSSMQQMLVANGIADPASYEAFVSTEAMHRTLRDSVSNMKEIDKAAFIAPTGETFGSGPGPRTPGPSPRPRP